MEEEPIEAGQSRGLVFQDLVSRYPDQGMKVMQDLHYCPKQADSELSRIRDITDRAIGDGGKPQVSVENRVAHLGNMLILCTKERTKAMAEIDELRKKVAELTEKNDKLRIEANRLANRLFKAQW